MKVVDGRCLTLSRQEEPRKLCACGRDYLYTAAHMVKFNPKVDGKVVCSECVIDNIYNKFKD